MKKFKSLGQKKSLEKIIGTLLSHYSLHRYKLPKNMKNVAKTTNTHSFQFSLKLTISIETM
jgi:hypothetical protein